MIRGYLSGEWLTLILIGLATSVYMARLACLATKEPPNLIATGIALSTGLYVLLRFAGRTPIGIAVETQPAARGHPMLSMVAFLVSFFVWVIAYFARN
jgi:hypothetical protein